LTTEENETIDDSAHPGLPRRWFEHPPQRRTCCTIIIRGDAR